ncbi:hypothetical protein V8C86DRAFT_2923558 [Haematococcus lacustris]
MAFLHAPSAMSCIETACFQGFVELPLKPVRAAGFPPEQQKSRLTASLQQCSRQQPAQDAPTAELRAILQNTSDSTPTTTFLGVSPPVRGGCCGGAANPLAKEAGSTAPWRLASHQNLQALRELDSGGLSFLSSHLLCGSPRSLASNDSGWCERAAQIALHKSHSKSIASSACRPLSWQQLQVQHVQHQQA